MTTFDVNKTPKKFALSLQMDLSKFEKATDEEKKPVEDAVKNVRDAIANDDLQKIKDAVEALNKAWEPIVKKIYAGTNPAGGQQFDPKQAEEFMKKHPEMFKDGGPFAGTSFTGANATNASSADDGNTVDAETV